MNKLEITCPSCNETFSADTALQNHLKAKEVRFQEEGKIKEKLMESKYKLEFQQKEKNLEKNLSRKIEEANKAKFNLLQSKVQETEQDKQELEAKFDVDLKKKDKALEQKLIEQKKILEKKVEEENKVKLKALQSKVQNTEKVKKELEAKFNFDLKQKDKLLEGKLLEQEKMLEKKLKNKSEGEVIKLGKMLLEKDKALLAKDKASEILIRRQQTQIDAMDKQLKQKSVEVQGEIQEELIQDFLRKKFPDDTVSEVKKGAKGADCTLSINHKDTKNLSQIYFESKDSKSFKEEWVGKLLKDMKDKSIDYGILVTSSLPKNFCKNEGHIERHGKRIMIVPMDYRIIYTLVSTIRTNLVERFSSKKDFDAPKEMKRLWDHITGPSFQLPVRNLYQTIHKMNGHIEKEKIFFEKNLANKERTMQDMDEEFKGMINSFIHKVSSDVLPETLMQIKNKSK